jgi:hypothetical protein
MAGVWTGTSSGGSSSGGCGEWGLGGGCGLFCTELVAVGGGVQRCFGSQAAVVGWVMLTGGRDGVPVQLPHLWCVDVDREWLRSLAL